MIIYSSIELLQHPIYGECAIASKDLRAGDIVIEESPLMTIDYTIDLLLDTVAKELHYKRKRAFMTLSHPAKVSLSFAQQPQLASMVVASFHLPNTTSSMIRKSMAYKAAVRGCKELRGRAEMFPEIKSYEDTQLVAFSMIASANAHAFDTNSIALLELGCKVTHSCFNPNVAASIRERRGESSVTSTNGDEIPEQTMKHIALVEVRKGDVLFGTYAKLTLQSVPERKSYLRDHKMFKCQCKYCHGLDKARGMKCSDCCHELEKDKKEPPVPLSSMYQRRRPDAAEAWVCNNCTSSTSSEELKIALGKNIGSEEIFRKRLQDLDDVEESPSSRMASFQTLYLLALTAFGWRHSLTASAALAFMDACSKVIDPSVPVTRDEIDLVLSSFETIPDYLEQWFVFLDIPPIEELAALYLFSSEQLMTLSSLHHEYIQRSMNIVQTLLLKVRPLIEQRRTWQIGHVLEEYYDELLQTLNALVNGSTGEEFTESETIEANEKFAV
ncbi:protein of unknown function [Taphrina deformans PYCC 5710]|uniref:SET domain-containing protein n=1 Tax=Taphrina deformans (strain PYCC 5710 / ATCC 11124 / CBS 356.35 / IMI 108563 / JCM 9778 / NBRC 8474) TaxID=1097556 RepID=R4X8I2_TAPDE|nr:protein of unknown function [Taphrina deformans PYCC 5710]|eukprot:CCG81919.1 protein of unknown function [Taphrina deformans PYCC 5710]